MLQLPTVTAFVGLFACLIIYLLFSDRRTFLTADPAIWQTHYLPVDTNPTTPEFPRHQDTALNIRDPKLDWSPIAMASLHMSAATHPAAFLLLGDLDKHSAYAQSLVSRNLTVFYIIDNSTLNRLVTIHNHHVFSVSLTDEWANAQGCHGSVSSQFYNRTHRASSSWDKALCFLIKLAPAFSFYWFVEPDVYIPTLAAFDNLHNKRYNESLQAPFDLISTPTIVEIVPSWYPINSVRFENIPRAEWRRGMVCAVGISPKLLHIIKMYISKYGRTEFVEAFFLTLALHHKLSTWHPLELNRIYFRNLLLTCENIELKRPAYWYHPMKNRTAFWAACNKTIHLFDS